MNFKEDDFKSKAEKEISRCRPGDWNHAMRVVEWVRKLGKDRNDLPLLISAAYIHDIGWRNVLKGEGKITFDILLQFETLANMNSEKFASDFLKNLKFTPSQIKTINRLIQAVDKHESISDDEMIIVDADNLSKLNLDHLKEKYTQSEWWRMYDVLSEMLPKLIKTDIGRLELPSLLVNLKKNLLVENPITSQAQVE